MKKTINLLPREPFAKRAFRLLFPAVLALSAASFAGILAIGLDYGAKARALEAEIRWIETRIAELEAQRAPDPLHDDFEAYRGLVESLEQNRRDWKPVLAAVAGTLPAGARITSMAVEENGRLTMSADFREWNDIGTYMARLRAAEPVEDVAVRSVSLSERQIPAPPGSAAVQAEMPSVRFYSAVLELAITVPS